MIDDAPAKIKAYHAKRLEEQKIIKEQQFISISKVAEMLNMSRTFLSKSCTSGDIPAVIANVNKYRKGWCITQGTFELLKNRKENGLSVKNGKKKYNRS